MVVMKTYATVAWVSWLVKTAQIKLPVPLPFSGQATTYK